jgi:hypothetical protein
MPAGRLVKSKYASLAWFFSPRSVGAHPWRSETRTCYVRGSACKHPVTTTSHPTQAAEMLTHTFIIQLVTEWLRLSAGHDVQARVLESLPSRGPRTPPGRQLFSVGTPSPQRPSPECRSPAPLPPAGGSPEAVTAASGVPEAPPRLGRWQERAGEPRDTRRPDHAAASSNP